MNDCGEVEFNKQVWVPFSIVKYEDEVLCDVVPIYAAHILPDLPLQFDRKVSHNGYRHRYYYEMKNGKVVLSLLKPLKAYEDQFRIV